MLLGKRKTRRREEGSHLMLFSSVELLKFCLREFLENWDTISLLSLSVCLMCKFESRSLRKSSRKPGINLTSIFDFKAIQSIVKVWQSD
jgi:hypothetical protein